MKKTFPVPQPAELEYKDSTGVVVGRINRPKDIQHATPTPGYAGVEAEVQDPLTPGRQQRWAQDDPIQEHPEKATPRHAPVGHHMDSEGKVVQKLDQNPTPIPVGNPEGATASFISHPEKQRSGQFASHDQVRLKPYTEEPVRDAVARNRSELMTAPSMSADNNNPKKRE